MTTRSDLVLLAMRDDGYLDGRGFDICNKFSSFLGHPCEAWCGDAVSTWFIQAQVPLPSMQPGQKSGFAYCPDAEQYGLVHGAIIPSWNAQPGDILLADWNNDGVADHTELVTGRDASGNLLSIGGNSGTWHERRGYVGDGGVHEHFWPDPVAAGNPLILSCLNVDRLVTFGKVQPPAPVPSPAVPAWPGRVLMLKSPHIVGADVSTWQGQMAHRGWSITVDGDFGAQSRDVCLGFQKDKGLVQDAQVGPATWAAAWTSPIT